MQPLPLFKIHCSAIHNIVSGYGGGLTDAQAAELDKLLNKDKALTFNQKMRKEELEEKRDAKPGLSQGAKTYCEEWVKSLIYSEPYGFTSKQTDKGNECEPDGLKMVARRMGYGMLLKNDEQFENEWCIGTPDALTKDTVEEIKCPYTSKTFPLFEAEIPTKGYGWQCQGYMWLTDRPQAAVNYCLINAPMHLIELEAKKKGYALGHIEVPMEIYDEMEAAMTYDDVPDALKHRRFPIQRSEKAIEVIKQCVILCREYIDKLAKDLEPVNRLYTPIENGMLVEKIQ